MDVKLKSLICVFLGLLILVLSSCGPSQSFLEKKEQGLYSDTSDFPNTKWVCREIDLWFYMLDYEEEYMIGTYTANGKEYRAVGAFQWDQLDFNMYSSTQISLSELSLFGKDDPLVRCERSLDGYILTEYMYENAVITCTLRNSQAVDGEEIPTTLTFDKAETIAQDPLVRWYAQELGMYLDSFNDANGYLRGEIEIDGQKHYVHAYEVGNDNYYWFSIENGKINNSRAHTSSPLTCMYFEVLEDKIIAKITDDIANSAAYPYWAYDGAVITFSRVSPDEST